MKILVQHAESNRDGEVTGYTDVAEVNASDFKDVDAALEYAYRYTNNVMGSWSIKEQFLPMRDGNEMPNGDYNDDVTVLRHRPDGMGQRSSMMGDRMIVDGKTYEIAAFGFKMMEAV
tara:strand:+ start:245 stop:595 length:351 start_codon:yes stop_codon:yes gene_type:complete